MQLHPVVLDESCLGVPLPWNLYLASGKVVVNVGDEVPDRARLDELRRHALFRPEEDSGKATSPETDLRVLMHTLDALCNAPDTSELVAGMHHLVNATLALTRADPDACLGITRRMRVGSPALRHCLLSAQLAFGLGERQGLEETDLKALVAAALTMNMAALPLHDALHGRDKLSPEEQREIGAHPGQAVNILYRAGVTNQTWLNAVFQHHENMDGSGYPAGLPGGDIVAEARMLRVADLYAAKISGRQYRPPRTSLSAMHYLFGDERRRIDRHMATQLLRRFGFFPPGTLARLENGEIAVVARLRPRASPLRHMLSFLSADGRPLAYPTERDTLLPEYAVNQLVEADPNWPAIAWQRIWGYP